MDRRRFIDRKEKIDDLQSEIESIDRAMADEKDIESDIDKNAMALTSMPGVYQNNLTKCAILRAILSSKAARFGNGPSW